MATFPNLAEESREFHEISANTVVAGHRTTVQSTAAHSSGGPHDAHAGARDCKYQIYYGFLMNFMKPRGFPAIRRGNLRNNWMFPHSMGFRGVHRTSCVPDENSETLQPFLTFPKNRWIFAQSRKIQSLPATGRPSNRLRPTAAGGLPAHTRARGTANITFFYGFLTKFMKSRGFPATRRGNLRTTWILSHFHGIP